MKRQRLKGRRTYLAFGTALAGSIALLIWNHFEPGLLSPALQAQLEAVVACCTVGLGLRSITSTPPGQSGQ